MVLVNGLRSLVALTPQQAGDFCLSKTVTLPLLLAVLYLIINDSKNGNTKAKTEDPLKTVSSVRTEETNSNPKLAPVEFEFLPESPTFDWETQEPIKYRPFKKGPYKLTMGIRNIPASEWFLIENTYKKYLTIKRGYVDDPHLFSHTIFMTPDCEASVIEFYEQTTQLLLKRYPMYFQIRGDMIYNRIMDEYIPLDPLSVENKQDLIVILSRSIEEDFILLFPDPASNDGSDEFIFKGGCFAFAAGFDPLDRFKTNLTTIHGPVPEYKSSLRPQMNKFFEKMRPGTFVCRNNWSVQTHNRIFVMNANKGVENEEIQAKDPNTLDFKREVFFRSERQVLTKLPKTGTMVFSIRTYLTPMQQIRDEGIGEELIGGIEGMQEHIAQYKRRPEWGPAVVAFLKGETDGVDKPEIGELH